METSKRCLAGTSGWQYEHWRGPFYPPDLAKARWFGYYSQRFDTVEINSTFYSLPKESTAIKWREAAPPGFVYAVKASRFITHFRRLKDPGPGLAVFFERTRGLGDKLGPILFQLPPRFPRDAGLLAAFLQALPTHGRHVFEFRDSGWFQEDVYDLLSQHGAALCIYELDQARSPVLTTADFAYVRLHGPKGRYGGDYGKDELFIWAGRMRGWADEGLDAYCYFDNDQAGYAAKNAAQLKLLLKEG